MTRDSDSYFSDDTDDINCNNNSSYNNKKKKRKINQVGVDASSVDNNNDLNRNEYNCKKKKYRCKKKGKWSGKSLKTKYKRVYKIKNSENFQSVFKYKKKQVYVGVYDTALKAAVAADFKAVEVGLPAEKLNFPENYNKYITGLSRASDVSSENYMEEDEDATNKFIAIRHADNNNNNFTSSNGNNDLDDHLYHINNDNDACIDDDTADDNQNDSSGTLAFLTLFNDNEYEQNNDLLSTTQIEIDDNLNVVDQVSLLRPPTKIVWGPGKPRKLQNNSGFKGVFPVKKRSSNEILHYYVQLSIKGKSISLKGRYKTPQQAAKVFDLHCCAMGRGPEYCNFPDRYMKMEEENRELIGRLSRHLVNMKSDIISRRNSSSRSSNVSSTTSSNTNSEDDVDELRLQNERSNGSNINNTNKKQKKRTDGNPEEIAQSDINAFIDKSKDMERGETKNSIPDDVVFNFDSIEAGNDHIEDNIINTMAMAVDVGIDQNDNNDDDEVDNNKNNMHHTTRNNRVGIVMPFRMKSMKSVNRISYI